MADRDLQLNRLRTKRSSRLVLEQHGHCEVPAGCGGVVLRWRSGASSPPGARSLPESPPVGPSPLEIWVYATCDVEAMIDGVVLDTSRPLLAPGPHVFACRLSGIPAGRGIFMMGAFLEIARRGAAPLAIPRRISPLLSRDDGTWKYAVREPSDDAWSKPGFDAAKWPALGGPPPDTHGSLLAVLASWIRRSPPPAPPKPEDPGAAYRRGRVAELGGEPLAIGGAGATMVIRKDFVVGEA